MSNQGPELLREVLSRLFSARGWGRRQAALRLEEAWRQAVSQEHAPHTQVVGLRHGLVEVVVENAVIMQELAHFQKRRLLKALGELLPGTRIADLRFRLGNVKGP